MLSLQCEDHQIKHFMIVPNPNSVATTWTVKTQAFATLFPSSWTNPQCNPCLWWFLEERACSLRRTWSPRQPTGGQRTGQLPSWPPWHIPPPKRKQIFFMRNLELPWNIYIVSGLDVTLHISQSHSTFRSEKLSWDVNQKAEAILPQEFVLRKLFSEGPNEISIHGWNRHDDKVHS